MNVAEATKTVATDYDGWCNYETWIVNVWITGYQGYYGQLCEIISSYGELGDQVEALEDWVWFKFDGAYYPRQCWRGCLFPHQ